MSTVGMFLAAFKDCPPTLSLLAGGASSIGGLATAGGITAAGAGATTRGGNDPAKAYLSSSCIMALISSISAPLMSSKV